MLQKLSQRLSLMFIVGGARLSTFSLYYTIWALEFLVWNKKPNFLHKLISENQVGSVNKTADKPTHKVADNVA